MVTTSNPNFKRAVQAPGDYYDSQGILSDYLAEYTNKKTLHCGNCNTPKEVYIKWAGEIEGYVGCMCECQVKQRSGRLERDRKNDRDHRRLEVFNQSLALFHSRISEDDERDRLASEAVRDYILNLGTNIRDGKGLLIVGETGVGKTFFAASVANEAIDRDYRVLFTKLGALVNEYTISSNKENYLSHLRNFDLIVLDDLGIERNTNYSDESAYRIIDTIYNSGISTIVTTNNMATASQDLPTQRIMSRLCERAKGILVKGKDRRLR